MTMPEWENVSGHYEAVFVQEVRADGEEVWTASHPALVGCTAAGESMEQAAEGLELSRETWLAAAEQLNRHVPDPIDNPLVQIHYARNSAARSSDESATSGEGDAMKVPVNARAA